MILSFVVMWFFFLSVAAKNVSILYCMLLLSLVPDDICSWL